MLASNGTLDGAKLQYLAVDAHNGDCICWLESSTTIT